MPLNRELNKYRIVHHSNALEWRDTVASSMKKNNGDFNPPFTERDQDFEQEVDGYVNERKELLRAIKDGKTVGILIFTRGGHREVIEDYCPCLYTNLVIVDQEHRNQGIGSSLYKYLETEIFPNCEYENIGVRTWKENKASQKCIKKGGFKKKAEEDGEYNQLYYYVYEG